MGVFLDKPEKEKEVEEGEGNGLRYALCSMQGWRVEMEDAHSIKLQLSPNLKDCSYFAVFDGHAGDFVSKHSSKHLMETIMELWQSRLAKVNQKDSSNPNDSNENSNLNDSEFYFKNSAEVDMFKETIVEGFLTIDKKMRELPKFISGEERSGTTAVATFITKDRIIFVNCGDSRAILCSNKQVKFSTQDHKPYNEEEKHRIENAGGSVMIQRVNGSLAVSRALGDYDYKNVASLPQTKQLVSPEPDVEIIGRCEDDEFLIIACDGIWDVMSNEEVNLYIRDRLSIHQNLQKICDELLETCLAKGSRDNMSVILVVFPAAPPINHEAIKKEEELDSIIKTKVSEIIKNVGETVTLPAILEELQTVDFVGLPPGGGIQSKVCMIENYLDEQLPNRQKEESRGSMLGSVPINMIRKFTSESSEQPDASDNWCDNNL